MIAALILDSYWWLAIPGMLLGLWAQFKLSSVYGRYSRVAVSTGLTGAAAAREILDDAGLHRMEVREVRGRLTDHYDPMKKALYLSAENYHGRSLAAVGVAAHEAGHALQHQAAYVWLQLRMWLVPATRIASWAWIGFIILGAILRGPFFAKFIGIAIGIFVVLTFFQVITLPVEFDASRRAKERLLRLEIIRPEEGAGVARVLSAAAMTYVAGMVSAVMELLHLILIARSGQRNG